MKIELSLSEFDGLIEALLFEAGERFSAYQISELTNGILSEEEIERALLRLEQKYFKQSGGIILHRNQFGFRLMANPPFKLKNLDILPNENTLDEKDGLVMVLILHNPSLTLKELEDKFMMKLEKKVFELQKKGYLVREKSGRFIVSKFCLRLYDCRSVSELVDLVDGFMSSEDESFRSDFGEELSEMEFLSL